MAKVNEISNAIIKELEAYSDEVAEKVKDCVDKASQDCRDTIKAHMTFKQGTGKYVKNFKLKTSFENKTNKRKTWYVAGGQHRLAHLLEYGHAKVNGGRTRAFPHIQYGEEIAAQNLPKYIKEVLK